MDTQAVGVDSSRRGGHQQCVTHQTLTQVAAVMTRGCHTETTATNQSPDSPAHSLSHSLTHSLCLRLPSTDTLALFHTFSPRELDRSFCLSSRSLSPLFSLSRLPLAPLLLHPFFLYFRSLSTVATETSDTHTSRSADWAVDAQSLFPCARGSPQTQHDYRTAATVLTPAFLLLNERERETEETWIRQ